MSLFLPAFQSVAILLLVSLVGFAIVSRRILPRDALKALYPLSLDVALPCLILANLLTRFKPSLWPEWWVMPLWWAGFTAAAFVLSLLAGRLAHARNRREFLLCLFYQNITFFPLILLTEMRGAGASLVDLFLFTMFFATFFFNTSHLFYARGGRGINWRRTLNPCLFATLIGVAVGLFGVGDFVPSFLTKSFALVGGMAAPLLMIVLGGSLYIDLREGGPIRWGEALKFVALKNFVFPLVALGVLALIRPERPVALLLLIQAAAPPLTGVVVIADREGGDRRAAGQFIVVSFVAALVSVPLALYFFERVFPLPLP